MRRLDELRATPNRIPYVAAFAIGTAAILAPLAYALVFSGPVSGLDNLIYLFAAGLSLVQLSVWGSLVLVLAKGNLRALAATFAIGPWVSLGISAMVLSSTQSPWLALLSYALAALGVFLLAQSIRPATP